MRLELPQHLRLLANIPTHEIALTIADPTLNKVIDAVEARYPALRGTIRDHHTQQRRPFLRFFACEEDISQFSLDAPLPLKVVDNTEPLLIIAGIAGG
jgi:molybdopterin synthase sulfur carrier subunit